MMTMFLHRLVMASVTPTVIQSVERISRCISPPFPKLHYSKKSPCNSKNIYQFSSCQSKHPLRSMWRHLPSDSIPQTICSRLKHEKVLQSTNNCSEIKRRQKNVLVILSRESKTWWKCYIDNSGHLREISVPFH